MESFIRPPEPLKDDNPNTWSLWKEEFLIFIRLLNKEQSPSYTANLFKNLIGIVGLEIINSKLSFNDSSEKEDFKILLKKFDNYYYPEETEVQKRFKFFTSRMKTNETMENYIQDLKKKADGCNLSTLTDSLVRDVIILNTSDEILRQRYMQEENLTCNKIIELYNNHKIYHRQNKTKTSNVQSKQGNKNKETFKQQEPPSVMSTEKHCWRCHTKHPLRQCPAWNYKCSKCNTFHHFEKCCKNQHNQSQNMSRNPNMNNLNMNDEKHVKEKQMNCNITTSNLYK